MKYLWHKLIADGTTVHFHESGPDLEQALKYLQETEQLEALYLHMVETIPGSKHWVGIRREEEHGATIYPATKGVFTDIDSISLEERKLLVHCGYLEEKMDEGVQKVFIKDKFNEKKEFFLEDHRLRERISSKRLETIFELLLRARKHYRRVRLSELREELCTYLSGLGLVLEQGDMLVIKGTSEQMTTIVFPEDMELTSEESSRLRSVLVEGCNDPSRSVPRNALNTRDPMAETLFGEPGRIIAGEKSSKDHKHMTYKVRVGRYVLSVVPNTLDQLPRTLERLMSLVNMQFLNIMTERLKRELGNLEIDCLNGIRERLKSPEGIDKNELQRFIQDTLQRFFGIGNTYCDITRAEISLIPIDEQCNPCVDRGPYKDFAGTVTFHMAGPSRNSISSTFSEVPPNVVLGELMSPYERRIYCCESVLEARSLWQQFTFESYSENNFTKNGRNCFSVYLSTFQELIQKIVSEVVKERAFKQVEYFAYTDVLTGMYNRRYFVDRLNLWLRQKREDVLLGFMDFDHFKFFNDYISHAFGDDILSWVGGQMKKYGDKDCVFGRIGGDEFGCVAKDLKHDEMRDHMISLLEVICTTPIPYTLSIKKSNNTNDDQEDAAPGTSVEEKPRVPFTGDLITLFYRLLGQRVDSGGNKRGELISNYVTYLLSENLDIYLRMLKKHVYRLSQALQLEIQAAHPEDLTPSQLIELLEHITSIMHDPYDERNVMVRNNELMRLLYETIVDFMKGVMHEKMLREMDMFFPVAEGESRDRFKALLEHFLDLQFEGYVNTDHLRVPLMERVGAEELSFCGHILFSKGIVSAAEHPYKDAEGLLGLADTRMYQDKYGRRAAVSVH